MTIKCEYCGNDNHEKGAKKCTGCGATLPEFGAVRKSNPFFYRGYIVFFIYEMYRQTKTAQFWLGERLVDSIEVTLQIEDEFVGEAEDPMPFYYELLKVSQGEQEIMRVEKMNGSRKAHFEIKRVNTPDEQFAARCSIMNHEQLYDTLKSR